MAHVLRLQVDHSKFEHHRIVAYYCKQCVEMEKRREVRRRAQAGANAWRAVERGDGRPADLKKTKGQGHEHLCHTGMPVQNGNFGTDQTIQQQQRLQVCENNWVRKIARSSNEGRDVSAEELDRETGEEQTTVGWTRRKDGGRQTTEESSIGT